jgi:hypothetical protein
MFQADDHIGFVDDVVRHDKQDFHESISLNQEVGAAGDCRIDS